MVVDQSALDGGPRLELQSDGILPIGVELDPAREAAVVEAGVQTSRLAAAQALDAKLGRLGQGRPPVADAAMALDPGTRDRATFRVYHADLFLGHPSSRLEVAMDG